MRVTLSKIPYLRLLIIVGALAVIGATILLSIKFVRDGNNGLDLAIYNQVAWHTVHGDWFGFTIHPHSYLGDHLELILLVLMPVYALAASPLTLVLLQMLFLAAAVWPLWLIARRYLDERWSFVLCVVWLASPFTQSIAAFEFHALALAPFFIFWTIYYYQREYWWRFVLFFVISLAIREDIALTLMGFSLISLLDKRSLRWRLFPLFAAGLWFIVALKISPLFTGYSQYKFLAYYGWLGNGPLAMLSTVINHPMFVLQNIITPRTFVFLIGLGLPFLFLFLLKPKYLSLIILPVIQYILLRNPGELTLVSHYSAPLLAPIYVAMIESLRWLHGKPKNRLAYFFHNEPGLVQTVLLTATLGGILLIGPLPGFVRELARPHTAEEVRLQSDVVASIPPDASVATGYYLITDMSSREKVYSLHYQFLGKRQFSDIDYRIPDDTEYAVVNADDALIYHVTYEETDEKNLSGDNRLREFLDPKLRGCQFMIDRFIVYKRDTATVCQPFAEQVPAQLLSTAIRVNENISFVGWSSNGTRSLNTETQILNGHTYRVLPLTTQWRADQSLDRDYSFKLTLSRGDTVVYEKRYPFAYGLFVPTSWQVGSVNETTYRFLIPDWIGDANGLVVRLQVELLDGRLWLDDWRGVSPTYSKITARGDPVEIGVIAD